MRYRVPLTTTALAVLTAACGDDSLSPPTRPRAASPSVSATALTCDPARIRTLITLLYPTNPARQTREGLLNKFSQGIGFMPNKQPQAWKKFVDIMRKVDDDFDAGLLPVLPPSPTTGEVRAELFGRLFVCAGYTAPDIPAEGDNIVGIIDDPTVQRTFISTDGDFAVQTPPGMFSQAVVVIGSKKLDSFIVQSIYDEFPIKTEITVNPSGKEVPGKKSIVKVCQYESEFEDDGANRGFMRIAQRHNVGEGSVVKVLQFTTGGPFLVCPESPPDLFRIASSGFVSRSFAAAAGVLRGARTLVVDAFASRSLYAATMVDGGVGGFVDQFFSFYAGVEVPDLTIPTGNITVVPTSPTTSSSLSFEIEVDNIGRGTSPPSTLHWTIANSATPTTILLQGNVSVTGIDGFTPGEGEGSGPGTAFVSVDFDGAPLPAGSYIFTATADFPNDVAELNESAPTPFANNVGTRAFTVVEDEPIPLIGNAASGVTTARSGVRLSVRRSGSRSVQSR